jgi:hypothetical protein
MKAKTVFFLLILTISAKLSGQDSLAETRQGVFVGLGVGTWFPDNKNKVLGHPLILDVRFDYRKNSNSFSLNFDLIGLIINKTTEEVHIKLNDSTVKVNDFFGSQGTFDYGRVLYSKNRFSFEINCGLGLGRLYYYNPTADIDIGKLSLILNPGMSFGLYVGKRDLLQLKTQYYISDYRLKDNVSTDFKGNFIEVKLIWTGTSKSW